MKVTNGSIYRKNISNNLPAAVEEKSADKTEAVEGPKSGEALASPASGAPVKMIQKS